MSAANRAGPGAEQRGGVRHLGAGGATRGRSGQSRSPWPRGHRVRRHPGEAGHRRTHRARHRAVLLNPGLAAGRCAPRGGEEDGGIERFTNAAFSFDVTDAWTGTPPTSSSPSWRTDPVSHIGSHELRRAGPIRLAEKARQEIVTARDGTACKRCALPAMRPAGLTHEPRRTGRYGRRDRHPDAQSC